jgi:hypothetical protein
MPLINERKPHITLVVDRYKTMDAVTINFTLPAGVLPPGIRSEDVAKRVESIIAANGFVEGNVVSHHHPERMADE